MEFHTLQEYYTFSKGVVYLIMGGILIAATLYWSFLMDDKDEKAKEFEPPHGHGHEHKK